MNKNILFQGVCLFIFCAASTLAADVSLTNTGSGNLSSLGGLDSKWFYSVSSSVDLSQQATITYPAGVYQPGYSANPLDPDFNSPLSRFIGTENNNGQFGTSGMISDPAGSYYFNTVVDGLGAGEILFRYETDNVLSNIYLNGTSLFASVADFNNFIGQAFNPVNTSEQQFFGFNGYYTLSGLNAGDILSFEITNQPGDPLFGNPLAFRAEFVATPEPMTYLMLSSFLLFALYTLPRRRAAA